MKKGKIFIYYDAEKLNAIENYAAKKGVDLLAEIDETIGRVYEKCVPSQVREFLEIRQQQEVEAKAKAAEKKPELSDSTGGEWQ
ncbi:MAG: hypothetical protein HFG20_00975 [Anaerotruncus sp.]|nr:hypothetical protein [Anaerotruncus sp.]